MIPLHISSETGTLRSVIVGIATDTGGIPNLMDVYDPKSLEHVLLCTYPDDASMKIEMEALVAVLQKYKVRVFRPDNTLEVNQIFTRDIGFVIEDYFFKSNILPNRAKEIQAIETVINQIEASKVITLPAHVHIEGGDVVLWKNYIFIGTYLGSNYKDLITARTNPEAVLALQEFFPNKKVKAFDLVKSNTNPRKNALHLDCCFQPIGDHQAIVYPQGFADIKDYEFLVDIFGEANLFCLTTDEMYAMNSNILSVSPKVIISEIDFTRLNNWLEGQGFVVEKIPFSEISKQEGLLRCSTLPLYRD